MNIKEAIKENTAIHCETESEAKRILNMAHELGYKGCYGRSFTDEQNNWDVNEGATCYSIIDGFYGNIKQFNDANYTIINSTDISFNFKTNEGAEHFKKMRREIIAGNL